MTLLSVVTRDSVKTVLNIAALNELVIIFCDIYNTYLTELCRENIWTFAGPEFGEEEGTLILCKNGIIWTKVMRRSIPIQSSRTTEGHWLHLHKRGPQFMNPTISKTRWHRIPRNGIILCWQRIGNIGNNNENY